MIRVKVGIRFKVLIITGFLLSVPWLGYQYIGEMESYLRRGQEKNLIGTAGAVAAALHERPALFLQNASFRDSIERGRDLYAYPLADPVQLDGQFADWKTLNEKRIYYREEYRQDTQDTPQSLSFEHVLGQYQNYIYALFDVNDDSLVFRSATNRSFESSDRLVIGLLSPEGKFHRYIIATHDSGWINGYYQAETSAPTYQLEKKIQGYWLKTASGYRIELRIHRQLISQKLAFTFYDVDEHGTTPTLTSIVGTAPTSSTDTLGTIAVPSPEIEQIIKGLGHSASRIWVIDKHGRVLAKAGDIHQSNGDWTSPNKPTNNSEGLRRWLEPLYTKLLTPPPTNFIDGLENSSRLDGKAVKSSLEGDVATQWRLSKDKTAVILAASHPIWIDQDVMGAVVVEETTNGIRSLRNHALEKLINLFLIIMLVGCIALLLFATNISSRIRRLRDLAENAIDEQGRVRHSITSFRAGDEIGDLSRSFSSIVQRLSEYNHYLENMAKRLSHEIRTPIAVVSSSLDNLQLTKVSEESQIYIDRAQDGIKRLNHILTNMGEATRLEQILQKTEKEYFQLSVLLEGCIEGYRAIYPQQRFLLETAPKEITIHGCPELIAQLLDKLISNAVEFARLDTPIRIRSYSLASHNVSIEVINQGPLLPDTMQHRLFDSMVSVRSEAKSEAPHLGLGLYIARLISDFHQATLTAQNLDDQSGVCFRLTLSAETSA